jgi:hypothetical protein
MTGSITRSELAAALVGLLRRQGITDTQAAIEVLGPPHYTVRLFAVILADHAKPILAEQLARTTGRLHPTVGDVWILTEHECAALIRTLAQQHQNRNVTDLATSPS